jgi:hypothetical protein
MTTEQKAELTRRVTLINEKQRDLARELDNLDRQIASMRKDIEGGFLPRYHGHVAATARKIDELGIVISTINSY